MGKILSSIVIMLVVIAGMCGFTVFKYKNPAELKTEVAIHENEYDADANLSTVTCKVGVKNNNYKYGRVITDFTYVVRFKGEDGLTLHEVAVDPDQVIQKDDYVAEMKFGAEGDYPALSGKVSKVEVEVLSFEYENTVRYRDSVGQERYDETKGNLILYFVCTVVIFWSFAIDVVLPFPDGTVRTILRFVYMMLLFGAGSVTFYSGIAPVLISLLA